MLTLEDLARLAEEHKSSLATEVKTFSLNGRLFDFNRRPAIMGVINLSADSWYRESVCLNETMAVRRGRLLMAQGADLVDVGAESTIPETERVDQSIQSNRLIPVVKRLVDEDALISVETYHSEVARASLQAGAKVLNLTGNVDSEKLFDLVREHDAAVILCFVQGANAREVSDLDLKGDPITKMYDYFGRRIETAVKCGVEKIILDPGLGFYYRNLKDGAERIRYQMNVFLNTLRLRKLGFPICHALPHAFEFFAEEVRCAEPFFAVLAVLGKTDLFRTHEVARTRAVLETMNAWSR